MTPCRDPVTLRRAHALAAAVLVIAAAPATAQPATAQPAACSPSERTVFACATGSKKIAVCASADLTATAGFVQYRFGRPAAAELVYPPAGADWRAFTRSGGLMFSGGGGAYLAFTNQRHRYVVYTAVGRGWGSKAGVVVEKAGKRVASLTCKGPVVSELGPDLFSAAGITPDDGSVDLP